MNDLNNGYICGRVKDPFAPMYEINGETFYCGVISVLRKSRVSDEVFLIASERTDGFNSLFIDDFLYISGDVRTRNIKDEDKRHLQVYIFADYITPLSEELIKNDDKNSFELTGTICKSPNLRYLPEKRVIADIIIAVNRTIGTAFIPCITFGRDAKYISTLKVGTRLSFKGRMQSRSFVKDNEIKTVREMAVTQYKILGEDNEKN